MAGLRVSSEIGTLRRVVLHTPGPEIEAMTPKEAEDDLYNDIIPLAAVRAEYDVLKAFLGTVAEARELVELLAESLAGRGDRFEFLTALSGLCPIKGRIEELMAMAPAALARAVIEGLPAEPGSLAARAGPRGFSMRPLPNAYFMRDSAAVVRDRLVSSATAFDVRLIESIITRFVFGHHPDFLAKGLLVDGPRERNRFVTIEGGDILVLSPTVLAVGVSERTTADAVERLAIEAARSFGEPMTVFAVLLPKERYCIHLDMVFTAIDRDAALVYAPLVTGPRRARALRVDAGRDGSARISEEEGLLQGLWGAGIDLEPIACGGGDPLHQEREQWWSGANSFAFAPGKIVMYSCNVRTLEALSEHGFEVKGAREFLARPAGGGPGSPLGVEGYGRLAVTFDGIELARGGGGARCMTLPVEREELD
ncbi:MAG TPA: arginine deiminase family protein [Spirochaetales bacterium]|nr:arginine deiminase family protein [Spirochaetales bacterium]HRY55878.1 arginine deiminase family protein [Spirochaetia bacterium]HRZ66387.1 arginine deiminase family protein [Spirochaetia bacterium]